MNRTRAIQLAVEICEQLAPGHYVDDWIPGLPIVAVFNSRGLSVATINYLD